MAHVTTLLFDEDPLTSQKRYFEMEDGSDQFKIITETTLDPTLEAAEDARGLVDDKSSTKWKADMHRVATLPMTIWQDLVNKGIMFDKPELDKWLNRAENKIFRIKLGRV